MKSDQKSMQTKVFPVQELKVNDRLFILLNEPDMVRELSSSGVALEMVACTGESVFLTPRAAPLSRLLEHAKNGNAIDLRHWMERTAAIRHMQDFILRTQRQGLPGTLSQAQLDAFDIDHLNAVFLAMSQRSRR